MSDHGRKDLHKKAEEKLTPDSSKSTVDKVKEKVTNAADKVKREVVPDSHKSGTQEAKDKITRSADKH